MGDATIDVVFAVLCLHNITEGRGKALQEIVRVLNPGGIAVISDLADTESYAEAFVAAGFTVTTSKPVLGTFPFHKIVVARRTGGAL